MKKSKIVPEVTTILRAADDEGGAGENSKRKAVSKRDYLDADGEPCDKIEEASGARYTLLGEGGRSFDILFGEAGNFATMCAIFGFHTKVGNVANTVLNDKDEPGGPAEAGEAIDAWLKSAQDASSPTWAERAGGVGIQIDKDALAGAVVEVSEAQGKPVQYDKVRQKLEEDKAFLRMVRQVPAIAEAYIRKTGKQVKSVDDVLGALS